MLSKQYLFIFETWRLQLCQASSSCKVAYGVSREPFSRHWSEQFNVEAPPEFLTCLSSQTCAILGLLPEGADAAEQTLGIFQLHGCRRTDAGTCIKVRGCNQAGIEASFLARQVR